MELKIKNGSPLGSSFVQARTSFLKIAGRELLILVAAMWMYSENDTSLVLV
jgi:hypothetical protein